MIEIKNIKKTKEKPNLLKLFMIFFKIGLVTFGGGYAMLSIVQDELVNKKSYIDEEEYYDFVSIAQGFPGPIAINIALLTGNRISGFVGSTVAMFGVAMPSFIIILIIAMFYKIFRNSKIVSGFFQGVQGVVPTLLLVSVLSMIKSIKKIPLNFVLFIATTVAVFFFDFNPIYMILIGGAVGICMYLSKRS